MKLNAQQNELHNKALSRAHKYKECEWRVIEVLQEVEATGLYKALECPSLFIYAVKFLDLDNALAYAMIRAARLSREIPRLEHSLKTQQLTVTKAARIFSTLTPHNAQELISYAEKHSADDINREVTRMREKEGLPARMRKIQVSDETYALIKRARSLSAKNADVDHTLKRIVNEHLDRHDPVRKAERAQNRKSNHGSQASKIYQPLTTMDAQSQTKPFCTYQKSAQTNPKRKPLTADEKHQVFARDGGQCTHRDAQGRRCTNDRFLHIHHIRPVSLGGTNDPANLTTLCSFHHDLAHQLTLPVDGQITWLRDVRVNYG